MSKGKLKTQINFLRKLIDLQKGEMEKSPLKIFIQFHAGNWQNLINFQHHHHPSFCLGESCEDPRRFFFSTFVAENESFSLSIMPQVNLLYSHPWVSEGEYFFVSMVSRDNVESRNGSPTTTFKHFRELDGLLYEIE